MSQKFEKDIEAKVQIIMEKLDQANVTPQGTRTVLRQWHGTFTALGGAVVHTDSQVVRQAKEVLYDCRRTLKYTYVASYFMENGFVSGVGKCIHLNSSF